MFLERIEIVGFRGVNRLSLSLTDSTLLIGENAWGKSSLLDALTLLLSPQTPLYPFNADDFHYPPGDEAAKERYLRLLFVFCEHGIGHTPAPRHPPFSAVLVKSDDNLNRIYYCAEGQLDDDGTVCTWRSFLGADGKAIPLHAVEKLVNEVVRAHPVLRLRDARFMRKLRRAVRTEQQPAENDRLHEQLQQLTLELEQSPQKLTNHDLQQGLSLIRQLIDHYFAEGSPPRHRAPGSSNPEDMLPASVTHGISHPARDNREWHSLNRINQLIAEPQSRAMRLVILTLFSTLLQANRQSLEGEENWRLAPHAHPLLLIEDPETRLHPIMLSIAWGLFRQLPIQRLITSNSTELVSLVPIENICRLVRESASITPYRLAPQALSPEEGRRIAFHIRFNRPSSLFARCWLLVEGETEIWLLNDLARQCGYHFAGEGVKVIEFAQCGLKPLLKFARSMGIEWHVLVDGDEAGKKYATTTRSFLAASHESERLTVLPARDIEHFMYREGFNQVYHTIARVPVNMQIPIHKVIEKAIHHASKPDVAIAVAMQASEWGNHSIPSLLRKMFSRVVWLARGKAD